MGAATRITALSVLVSIGVCSCSGDVNRKNHQGSGGFVGGGGESPADTGGVVGSAGTATTDGAGGGGGTMGIAGAGGASGTGRDGAAGSGAIGDSGGTDARPCCPDGDCLCHGPDPTGLTAADGPFATESFGIPAGKVHYPTDAEPPFASVALETHVLSSGPDMNAWGSFYASHGIVTIIVIASTADHPDTYAAKLLEAIAQLKGEHTKSGSPLLGKLSDRYGVSGYSVGAGGTTIASGSSPTLKSSVVLAPWGGNGSGVQVPTLLLCGGSDPTAPCSMSESVYAAVPETTPKMMVSIPGATHFSWYDPTSAGTGTSGETALAFQKVFLEGDQRWKRFLLQNRGTTTTNIQ